ncbi:Isoaspartyl peptidase [Aquicella siphonis]|uniref:Isoaspartyl peptidase n=1 Tax=Aquicella siphonis TaxID=254247 RepID=A0A5E4PFL9_9COXI|nr:isoaspartyl peptidase/L-asparaginase [Aquicella siphonis]VVC75779.1 Isoaspartyl peptidase [Aquicella siphonis]
MQKRIKPTLLVHGGCGAIRKADLSPRKEKQFHTGLSRALKRGYEVIMSNGTSVEAVREAIICLEDMSLFNAGYGSVLTEKGTIECDAAIMDGSSLQAGAAAGLSRIQNPICLAEKILMESEHVLLIGPQAEQFARTSGMKLIPQNALITPRQFQRWKKLKTKPHSERDEYEKHGTVGAVALDQFGNLAAGTSTGGIMHKKPGRVGDSPIIGAGTYADNETCALSVTGVGEYFIRMSLAYDVCAQMKYKHYTLKRASTAAIKRLTKWGGTGGIISLDRQGHAAMIFNTEGMYRGMIQGKEAHTYIY